MNSRLWRRAAIATILSLALLGLGGARAEHTRRWRSSTYEDFLKGTARGVAIRSDGRLELAPRFHLHGAVDASYVWSLRLDAKGVLYAAGGLPAKVFRFDGEGKSSVFFHSTELLAQAIAFDAKNNLYAATSPEGKVYRVSPQGEKSVFFDPKTKYIWEILFGPDGTLYVATGDTGKILAVAPSGKSEEFYSTDEAHVRVLALDGKGNLLAGTEPSGRILRIPLAAPAAGQTRAAFVLHETSKREVTALLAAPDGSIYAAAIGEKSRIASPVLSAPAPGTVQIAPGGAAGVALSTLVQQPGVTFNPFSGLLSSAVYHIRPDGMPEEIWSSREELVYSLGFNSDGRVLAGTGNNGALLLFDGHGVFAQLAKSGSSQITGIARAAGGRVYLCTANPGKVFAVGPEIEPEGSYESQSFDAQIFSRWGRIDWWSPPAAPAKSPATNSSGPRIAFYVRAGNTDDPGREWSAWAGPYTRSGQAIEAPPARFVQWKAVIRDGRAGDGIQWVSVDYQPRNVAPVIDAIVIQDPGVRLQGMQGVAVPGLSAPVNVRMPAAPGALAIPPVNPPKIDPQPQGSLQKGYRSAAWSARDENDDELRFAVYFRGEDEHGWKLLKDNLEQKFFSWDTTSLPDGAYTLRIVATDAPSNPSGAALTAERESDRFEVDNTPPVIQGLEAVAIETRSGTNTFAGVVARFTARDAATGIDRAQYSVDGREWILVEPAAGISGAPEEKYEIMLTGLTAGEHTLAVRAFDRFENVGSAKIVFQGPAGKP